MKATQILDLAESFRERAAAARHARQSQAIATLGANLDAALKGWSDVRQMARAFDQLKIDWSGAKSEVSALRQLPFKSIQELLFASEDVLAAKPANTFRGAEQRNLELALDRMRREWTVWCDRALSEISWLDPLMDRVANLKKVKSEIVALRKDRPTAPPKSDDEIDRSKKWVKQVRAVLDNIDQLIDKPVAAFLSTVLRGGGWLSALTPKTLEWLQVNQVARHLQVSFSITPSPNAGPVDIVDDEGEGKSDDDWE